MLNVNVAATTMVGHICWCLAQTFETYWLSDDSYAAACHVRKTQRCHHQCLLQCSLYTSDPSANGCCCSYGNITVSESRMLYPLSLLWVCSAWCACGWDVYLMWYYTLQAYVKNFSEGLHQENRHRGIIIQVWQLLPHNYNTYCHMFWSLSAVLHCIKVVSNPRPYCHVLLPRETFNHPFSVLIHLSMSNMHCLPLVLHLLHVGTGHMHFRYVCGRSLTPTHRTYTMCIHSKQLSYCTPI